MNSERYSLVARLLHWTVAGLVLVQIGLGFGADWSERPLSDWLLDQHVRFGLLILALMVLRLSWRLAVPAPPLPAVIKGWRRRVAGLTHLALYLLLLAMPVSGYVLWAWTEPMLERWGSGRVPISFRGGDDEFWRSVAGYGHQYGAYAVSALVILHIMAAAHHQFVVRDRLIGRRMGFGPLDGDADAG